MKLNSKVQRVTTALCTMGILLNLNLFGDTLVVLEPLQTEAADLCVVGEYDIPDNFSIPEYDDPIVTEPNLVVVENLLGDTCSGNEINLDLIYSQVRTYDYYPDWDYQHKINTLSTAYTFLTEGYGLSPEFASAILGNVACEGDFGTTARGKYTDIDVAYDHIGEGAFGIVQWCNGNLKDDLRLYYDYFRDTYGDTYDDDVLICLAECSCLYYEIYEKGWIEKYNECTDVEHLTGIFALYYEAYAGSGLQWGFSNGLCRCTAPGSNGGARLTYAKHVYEEFNSNEEDIVSADVYNDYLHSDSGETINNICGSIYDIEELSRTDL